MLFLVPSSGAPVINETIAISLARRSPTGTKSSDDIIDLQVVRITEWLMLGSFSWILLRAYCAACLTNELICFVWLYWLACVRVCHDGDVGLLLLVFVSRVTTLVCFLCLM